MSEACRTFGALIDLFMGYFATFLGFFRIYPAKSILSVIVLLNVDRASQ